MGPDRLQLKAKGPLQQAIDGGAGYRSSATSKPISTATRRAAAVRRCGVKVLQSRLRPTAPIPGSRRSLIG